MIEIRRDSGNSYAELKEITFWWAVGEPAYIQKIDLNLTWTATSCAVSTR